MKNSFIINNINTLFKVLFASIFALSLKSVAQLEALNNTQQQLYLELSKELRCLVCQNQSIGDSNAPLAIDLRTIIVDKIKEGQDRDEIISFMRARYGDFVVYKPPFNALTFLLWIGPILLFAIGLTTLYRILLKRQLLESDSRDDVENAHSND